MEFTDTQSLDDDEMGRLVSITLEEFGLGLTRAQFNDAMLALAHRRPRNAIGQTRPEVPQTSLAEIPTGHPGKPAQSLT